MSPAGEAQRLQRLPLPDGTRECLIVETDGTVLFSHPVSRTREALAAHLVRVAGIASATLARAGLGPLRRAAVGSNSGTTFVQGDARLILSLTLPPDVAVVAAQRETNVPHRAPPISSVAHALTKGSEG